MRTTAEPVARRLCIRDVGAEVLTEDKHCIVRGLRSEGAAGDLLAAFLKLVRKVSPETVPDKRKRDYLILTVAKRVFELRASQYATSYAHDSNELLVKKTGRYQKAVTVRWGEKVLLLEATLFARKKLEAMDMDAGDDAPAAKKQRTK